MQYYLCFKVNKIPDLTMVKYSVYDISGQEDLIGKHTVFLRQLHRLGVESNVFFTCSTIMMELTAFPEVRDSRLSFTPRQNRLANWN